MRRAGLSLLLLPVLWAGFWLAAEWLYYGPSFSDEDDFTLEAQINDFLRNSVNEIETVLLLSILFCAVAITTGLEFSKRCLDPTGEAPQTTGYLRHVGLVVAVFALVSTVAIILDLYLLVVFVVVVLGPFAVVVASSRRSDKHVRERDASGNASGEPHQQEESRQGGAQTPPRHARLASAVRFVSIGFWVPVLCVQALWALFLASPLNHGRPLRLRGKPLRASVKPGGAAASAEWSAGPVPVAAAVAALSSGTRGVLARMWREDGRTEHASVPAFTRMSWQLMGVGAPASLVSGCHRAAMEEVEHAQRCFALARAYGATDTAVQAMPSLLASAASEEASVEATVAALVRDNLVDGGVMEGLSADVVGARAAACEVAEVRAVLEQIAREERSHAALSWAVLAWLREAYPVEFESALTAALKTLETMSAPRWSAPTWQTRAMGADPHALRQHGGPLDAAETRQLWDVRMEATRTQAAEMLRRAGEPDAGEVA